VDTWNRLKWYEYYENPYATIQGNPIKKVTWKCPNQYCNGPEGDWKNVQRICPYCLQVPPACIKWLVDHNAARMFSHVFMIKGSPKTADGKWIENEDWLRAHHAEYDASYQQTVLEEDAAVEHEYQERQREGIQELREKTKSTMRGALYWKAAAWPERTYVNQYEIGHYEPKSENSTAQNMGQIRLLVGKYKKIEVVVNTNRFVAHKAPMKIENVLLHPRVKGPTRASKAYNTLKPTNALNWWGIHGEENPLTYGMENVNAVCKNKYSSRLPGYLSIRSDYTKLASMIPCPSKNLRDPMSGEMYCVYVAYGGMVPSDDEEGFDYVPPTEQVYVTTIAKRRKRKSQDICKSVRTNTEEWLFDTGATVHITPCKHLLFNTSNCYREIKVANGKYVRSYLVGDILLRSECGNFLVLRGVLYSPASTKTLSVHLN
jgi:hypothetical protein